MQSEKLQISPNNPVRKETKSYRFFILSVSLAILVVIFGIFSGVSVQTKKLIKDEQLAHVKAYFDLIMLTRMWNANHGGVFVKKTDEMQPQPMLDRFNIETRNGEILVLRNPAVMTREISEYTKKYGQFSFHITSLNPTNPKNMPDAFDRKALLAIDSGADEYLDREVKGNRTFLRYMKPLYVKDFCLNCHADQNYEIGEVRGGISLTLDVTDTQKKLTRNVLVIVLFSLVALSFLMVIVWYFTGNLFNKMVSARKEIEEMAITDGLTALYNRRYLEQRLGQEFKRAKRNHTSLSCMLLDIDHFKSINDTHGHDAGDVVLKNVSQTIKSNVRDYDIVGRYGGEEFIIVLPHTSIGMAKRMAERLRKKVKELKTDDIAVTISVGVTRNAADDSSAEDIVKRADINLYQAKENGRDCVRSCEHA